MNKEKTLTLMDMIGMALAAFVSMELIASQATLGTSVIGAFLLIGGSYVLTHCLICAELGSTFPDQGGIYSWVKRGLGNKWAARTNWWYWLNVVGFVPSVMIPTIAIFKQLFWPEMSTTTLVIVAIAGTWLVMGCNMLPLKESKLLTTAGTTAKVLFCLTIMGAAVYVAIQGNSQITLTVGNIMPKFDIALLALIPTFTYGLSGMDMIGCMADEMHNPKKDMPKAMIIATIVAMVLYILSIVAVEVILPAGMIDETSGLIDAIISVFGASRIVITVIGVGLALVYFSNAFAWPLAANKAAQEAAESGEFPKVFAKTNKYGSPIGGAVIMGLASTALLVFYGLVANSNEGLFWTILAFTGIIFFLPYIMMSFAFLKLRKTSPVSEDSFRIKGKVFPQIVAWFHALLIIGSTIFFLIPPKGENPVVYVGVLVATLVGTQIVGEIIIKKSQNKK